MGGTGSRRVRGDLVKRHGVDGGPDNRLRSTDGFSVALSIGMLLLWVPAEGRESHRSRLRVTDETPRPTTRRSTRCRATGRCHFRNIDVMPVCRSEFQVWQQEPGLPPLARSPILRGPRRRMWEQTWEHTWHDRRNAPVYRGFAHH